MGGGAGEEMSGRASSSSGRVVRQRRRARGLRVNAVRGDVAALLVVGADFGEPPVRSVRIVCASLREERKGNLTS